MESNRETRGHARSKKNGFENRKFRMKGWSRAFLDRVAVKSNSDSDRPAPNGAGRRWTWSETPLQKKREKKRRGDGPKERTFSELLKNSKRERTPRASRPQFHAIESAQTKLKTNRFPAPCWHALHLFAVRATWTSECKKKKKKTCREPHIYAYKNKLGPNTTRMQGVIDLYKRKRRNQATISDDPDPKRVIY